MIKATCKTNLDNYDCTLVTEFGAIPRIGDYVQVTYKGNVSELKICKITHKQLANGPCISVELHN